MDILKTKEDWKNLFAIYITITRLEQNYISSSFRTLRRKSVPQAKRFWTVVTMNMKTSKNKLT